MKPITLAGIAGTLVLVGGAPVTAVQATSSDGSDDSTTTVQTTTADDAVVPGTETDSADDFGESAGTGTTTADEGDADEATEAEPVDDSSALGQAHAAAMKAWARCVAEAASGPKVEGQLLPPKEACGTKPLGPGRIMRLADQATTESGETETIDNDSTEEAAETDETEADTVDTSDADNPVLGSGAGASDRSHGHGHGHGR
jgi:hypothetical protein